MFIMFVIIGRGSASVQSKNQKKPEIQVEIGLDHPKNKEHLQMRSDKAQRDSLTDAVRAGPSSFS
jgi:hypothetical protein